jgi:hypothetical protein
VFRTDLKDLEYLGYLLDLGFLLVLEFLWDLEYLGYL